MALFEDKVKVYSPRLQKDVGIKGFQADGVFGNLGEESNGFTQLHQIHGNGLGWAQWDDRRKAFEKYAADNRLSVLSDAANYGFLVHELKTTENAALRALKLTKSRDEACESFMRKFERPGKPALNVRIRWAIRAEAARLEQEKKMSDTSGIGTQPIPTAQDNVLATWIKQHEVPAETVIKQLLVAKGVPSLLIDAVFSIFNQLDLQTGLSLIQHINIGGLVSDLKQKGVQLPSFSSLFGKLHLGG